MSNVTTPSRSPSPESKQQRNLMPPPRYSATGKSFPTEAKTQDGRPANAAQQIAAHKHVPGKDGVGAALTDTPDSSACNSPRM